MKIENCDVEKILQDLSGGNSDYINYKDFLHAAIDKRKLLDDEAITRCFNMIDGDGNGNIDIYEFSERVLGTGTIDEHTW